MIKQVNKKEIFAKKHRSIRQKISGTSERPRLCVHRTNKHIYAQLIDDVKGVTVASANTTEKALNIANGGDIEAAKTIGTTIAERAKKSGVEEIVFDRGGYLYHGRVAAVADAAREAGLIF